MDLKKMSQEKKIGPIASKKKLVSLGKLADDYGTLKAKIKDLEDLLFLVRAQLIESGQDVIEGNLFRVTVANVERITLDTVALKEAYPSIAEEFERLGHSIVVRCSSR